MRERKEGKAQAPGSSVFLGSLRFLIRNAGVLAAATERVTGRTQRGSAHSKGSVTMSCVLLHPSSTKLVSDVLTDTWKGLCIQSVLSKPCEDGCVAA